MFGHAKIYMNDCFLTKTSSAKGDYLCVSLISSEDSRLSRACHGVSLLMVIS